MTKKYLNIDQRGVALFTVVLIFLVLVTLLGGVMFASVVNQRNSILAKDHTAVYYIAESGINLEIAKIEGIFELAQVAKWNLGALDSELGAVVPQTYDFEDNMGKKSWAETSVALLPFDPVSGFQYVRVTSIGNIGDVSRVLFRDIAYRIVLGPGNYDTFLGAIIARGSINVGNKDITVVGPIASNLENFTDRNGNTIISKITLSDTSSDCHGITEIDVLDYESGDVSVCSSIAKDLDQDIVFSDIEMPDSVFLRTKAQNANIVSSGSNGLLDLSAGRVFKLSRLNTTGVLTVVLEKTDKNRESDPIFVLLDNSITILPQSIIVEGKGRLIFISSFEIDFNPNSLIRYKKGNVFNIDPSKVSFVLDAPIGINRIITMKPSDVFAGSILSDSTGSVDLKGTYGGYLVTSSSNVTVQTPNSKSGTLENTVWIYAPNADFTMQAGPTFYGSIMAKSFYANQPKTELIYDKTVSALYPFEEWTPLPYTVDQNSAKAELEVKYLPTLEN